jgi:hypothetical protein
VTAETAADRAALAGAWKKASARWPHAPDLVVQMPVVPRSALPEVLDQISEIRIATASHQQRVSCGRRQPAPEHQL